MISECISGTELFLVCFYRFCRGCKLECNSELYNYRSCYIAVDWEPTALHLRYQTSQERVGYQLSTKRIVTLYNLIQKSDSLTRNHRKDHSYVKTFCFYQSCIALKSINQYFIANSKRVVRIKSIKRLLPKLSNILCLTKIDDF